TRVVGARTRARGLYQGGRDPLAARSGRAADRQDALLAAPWGGKPAVEASIRPAVEYVYLSISHVAHGGGGDMERRSSWGRAGVAAVTGLLLFVMGPAEFSAAGGPATGRRVDCQL